MESQFSQEGLAHDLYQHPKDRWVDKSGLGWKFVCWKLVSSPDLLQHCKRKGRSGEYSTTFLPEFRRYNLIGCCSNYLTCTGLPYCKPLTFTHHTFTDLLSTPAIY